MNGHDSSLHSTCMSNLPATDGRDTGLNRQSSHHLTIAQMANSVSATAQTSAKAPMMSAIGPSMVRPSDSRDSRIYPSVAILRKNIDTSQIPNSAKIPKISATATRAAATATIARKTLVVAIHPSWCSRDT